MATPIPANQACFTLRQIAEICGGNLSPAASDVRIKGVAVDSRATAAGGLFVALRGGRRDGHDFIPQAVRAGAAAALVERGRTAPGAVPVVEVADTLRALGDLAASFRRGWGGRLVAITGSTGKTTTKELLAAALGAAGARVLASHGNLNNLIGVPTMLMLLTDEYDLAVMELGTSAPGEMARLAEIARPDIGVVVSVAAAHTEGLGSLQTVAEEKMSLLKALEEQGVAVYNADSELMRPLLKDLKARRRLSFGRGAAADVRLVSASVDSRLKNRCKFEVPGGGPAREAELSLLGEAAALDAAAALAAALACLGPERLDAALAGLSRAQPVEGRMRPAPGLKHTLLLDDTYNSNPESAVASLRTVREIAQVAGGRAVAILGDMAELGARSSEEHQKVGSEAVRQGMAVLIACGREMAAAGDAARREAQGSVEPGTAVVYASNLEQAIASARELIRERDVVLIKGSRCMEMERVLGALGEQAGTET